MLKNVSVINFFLWLSVPLYWIYYIFPYPSDEQLLVQLIDIGVISFSGECSMNDAL